MKKYTVTNKHEFLKESEVSFWDNGDKMSYGNQDNDFTFILDYGLSYRDSWLKSGWIEEIQQPEFTKNDMIDFLNYFEVNNNRNPKNTEEGCRNWFDAWINFRKNESK